MEGARVDARRCPGSASGLGSISPYEEVRFVSPHPPTLAAEARSLLAEVEALRRRVQECERLMRSYQAQISALIEGSRRQPPRIQ